MADLELNETLSVTEKENKIRAAFDSARKDIAVIQAKKECKKEEMAVLEAEAAAFNATTPMNGIPPNTGTVLTNTHPSNEARVQ